MEIIKMVESKMGQNTYLVVEGHDAILIDCGVGVDVIEENLKVYSPKPKIKGVFLTHCHFDHIGTLNDVMEKYKCLAYIAKSGKEMLYDPNKNLSNMDTPFVIKSKREVKTFGDMDTVSVGESLNVKCYITPGHSIDSSCFEIENSLFTGDTLFKVDVGRTDLYSGDSNMLTISLERMLGDFEERIDCFYPGHGANFNSSEMKYNIGRILGEM